MSDSGPDFRMDPATDPRTIITPDAFQVAPELLGLSLARPWRRAAAILIDLTLVALLANARVVFFAVAFGAFVFWLAVKRRQPVEPPSCARRAARSGLGCMGAATLTVVALVTWFGVTADPDEVLFEADTGGQGFPVTISTIRDLMALARGGDSAEVSAAAERLVETMEAQDVGVEEMREVVSGFDDESDSSMVAVLESVLDARTGPQVSQSDTIDFDTLLALYSAARTAGDTAAMVQFGPVLGSELATEELADRDGRIARLEARNGRLDDQLTRSREELDDERNKGILNSVIGMLDELGLGLGWSGLYFTFCLGFWRGRTPGKKLLGIRVVRLDGRPLGYWVSFERFGGYAASLFTGLEGFARILWDRNRQALEDKLAETVVIVDTADAKRRVANLHSRA
ncbi:MAG: RDD family protein [Gemmatimonadota bacterium]